MLNKILRNVGVAGVLAFVVVLIVAGPLMVIWALNTVFPVLAIPYTFWTWLATLILASTIRPTISSTSSR